jgi:peroxiredoxin
MRRQSTIQIITAMVLMLAPFSGLSPNAAGDTPRKPAPNFATSDSKGIPVQLADFKGKVVLLNFWATWCHGCGEEIPWFIQYQEKYKSQGFAVLGVSMDDEGWTVVTPFVREKKVNYVVVVGDKKLGDLFGLAGMPMTVLIDRNGNIATKYEGVVNRETCEKEIRTLLAEKLSAAGASRVQ